MADLIQEIKERIIESLRIEDVEPGDIDSDAPLFGEALGLDSIDALELVVMVEKYYGIQIVDIELGREAFQSVRALADFITENKTSA
jgi:acyl carrier protein